MYIFHHTSNRIYTNNNNNNKKVYYPLLFIQTQQIYKFLLLTYTHNLISKILWLHKMLTFMFIFIDFFLYYPSVYIMRKVICRIIVLFDSIYSLMTTNLQVPLFILIKNLSCSLLFIFIPGETEWKHISMFFVFIITLHKAEKFFCMHNYFLCTA